MMKVNLIGDNYVGPYRISGIEWVLGILNLVLMAGLVLYQQFSD